MVHNFKEYQVVIGAWTWLSDNDINDVLFFLCLDFPKQNFEVFGKRVLRKRDSIVRILVIGASKENHFGLRGNLF